MREETTSTNNELTTQTPSTTPSPTQTPTGTHGSASGSGGESASEGGGVCNSIACINCRQSHRKCDKLLAGCSYCKKTNKNCVYREPKKRSQSSSASKADTPTSRGTKRKIDHGDSSTHENSNNTSPHNGHDHWTASEKRPKLEYMNDSLGNNNTNGIYLQQQLPSRHSAISSPLSAQSNMFNPQSVSPMNVLFQQQHQHQQQQQQHLPHQHRSLSVNDFQQQQPISPGGQFVTTNAITTTSAVTPISNVQTNELVSIMNQVNMTNMMDFYYGVYCADFPLLQRQQSNEVLRKIMTEGLSHRNVNCVTLNFMSIMMLCLQRLGKKDMAHQVFIIFNQYYSSVFYSLMSSYGKDAATHNIKEACTQDVKNISYAIATVAYYVASAEGELVAEIWRDKCKFMFEYALRQKEIDTILVRQLEKYIFLSNLIMYQHENLLKWLQGMKDIIIHFYFDRSTPVSNFDLVNASSSDQVQFVDAAMKAIDAHFHLREPHLSALSVTVIKAGFRIALEGQRMQIVLDQPVHNIEYLKAAADRVTECVRNHESIFVHFSAIGLRGLALASHVHLKYGTLSEYKIEDVIKADLFAMKTLAEKYDIISQRYQDMMNSMEVYLSQSSARLTEGVSSSIGLTANPLTSLTPKSPSQLLQSQLTQQLIPSQQQQQQQTTPTLQQFGLLQQQQPDLRTPPPGTPESVQKYGMEQLTLPSLSLSSYNSEQLATPPGTFFSNSLYNWNSE